MVLKADVSSRAAVMMGGATTVSGTVMRALLFSIYVYKHPRSDES